VTGFSPATGVAGSTVTITGTNLGLGFQPAPIVKFGTTTVTTPLTFSGQTSVSFAVPAGLAAGTYSITIGGATGTPITVGTYSVTVPVAAVVPAAPTGVVATPFSATQIDLSWTAVSGATGYNIYKGTAAGVTAVAAKKVNAVSVAATTFSSTGLFGAIPYFYVVTAVNSAGESIASAEVTATTSAVPAGVVIPVAPTTFFEMFRIQQTATGIPAPLSGQIPIVAMGSLNATGFNVYRSTTPGFVIGAANLIGYKPSTIQLLSYTDTGLAPATRYYYKITALNAAGESPASPEFATVTPLSIVGVGTGLTLAPAFGTMASVPSSIPYQGGFLLPANFGGNLLSSIGMDSIYYNAIMGATPVVNGFTVSYSKDSANNEFIWLSAKEKLTNGAELNVPSVTKNCSLAAVAGTTLCSTLGITLDRVAGTVTFVSTPMIGTTGAVASVGATFTISGSLSFTPY
jgi:hypothetical protein